MSTAMVKRKHKDPISSQKSLLNDAWPYTDERVLIEPLLQLLLFFRNCQHQNLWSLSWNQQTCFLSPQELIKSTERMPCARILSRVRFELSTSKKGLQSFNCHGAFTAVLVTRMFCFEAINGRRSILFYSKYLSLFPITISNLEDISTVLEGCRRAPTKDGALNREIQDVPFAQLPVSFGNSRPLVANVGALFAFDSTIGRVAKAAMELAVKDVNNNHSLLSGTKLELSMVDSNCSAFIGTAAG
ncbi:hypothetical protein SUGI_1203140 [Cryptomeria japonica]|nr:hypothetical protein SUGI_1203140 [Cryptomeria japonica]